MFLGLGFVWLMVKLAVLLLSLDIIYRAVTRVIGILNKK